MSSFRHSALECTGHVVHSRFAKIMCVRICIIHLIDHNKESYSAERGGARNSRDFFQRVAARRGNSDSWRKTWRSNNKRLADGTGVDKRVSGNGKCSAQVSKNIVIIVDDSVVVISFSLPLSLCSASYMSHYYNTRLNRRRLGEVDTITPRRSQRNLSVATTNRRHSTDCKQRDCHSFERSNSSPSDSDSPSPSKGSDDKVKSDTNEKIILNCNSIRKLLRRSSFYKTYDIISLIGQGNFSHVFMVHGKDEKKYAVKEIDKNRMHGKTYFIENEVALLKECTHKNICNLREAFECSCSYFLVFEYASNGDLFEMIKRMDKLNEQLAARITSQIASALHYIHSKNIVHRDVKPENILLDSNSTAKLTDFGLACTVLGPLYRVCGTPTYVAPEVLAQQGYGYEIDVWSLGILLHVMLIGYPPFRNSNRAVLFKMILKAQLNLNLPIYVHISNDAKQLISELLTPIVDRRLKSVEVKHHKWVQKHKIEFHYSRL